MTDSTSSEHHSASINPKIKWIDIVTDWMDNKIKIPGTNIRFGLDFLIGLVPYIGDVLSFGISILLLLGMARNGASGMLVLKMMWNVFIDATVGSIPLLGDIFDLQYRANWRNLKLYEAYIEEGKHQGSAFWPILILLVTAIGLIVLLIYVIWTIFSYLGTLIMDVIF